MIKSVQEQLDIIHAEIKGLNNVNVAVYGQLHSNTLMALLEEGINLKRVSSTLLSPVYEGIPLHVLSLGMAKFDPQNPVVDITSYRLV